jgi:vacuolar iron transporter family protein
MARQTPNDVEDRLVQAWRGAVEAGAVYELIAERERDPERAEVLRKMAAAESGHRLRLEARMRELGRSVPDPSSVKPSRWLRLQARLAPLDRLTQSASTSASQKW